MVYIYVFFDSDRLTEKEHAKRALVDLLVDLDPLLPQASSQALLASVRILSLLFSNP